MATVTNLATRIKIAWPSGKTLYFVKGMLDVSSQGNNVYINDATKKEAPARLVYTEVSGMSSASELVDLLLSYDITVLNRNIINATIFGATITDSGVITAITSEANWSTNNFVDPGGILAAILAGQVYLDTTNKIMYYYNGTTLVRWYFNNIG